MQVSKTRVPPSIHRKEARSAADHGSTGTTIHSCPPAVEKEKNPLAISLCSPNAITCSKTLALDSTAH